MAKTTRPLRGETALLAESLRLLSEGVIVARAGRGPKAPLTCVFANRAFCELTGYSEAELIGRPLDLITEEKEERKRIHRWAVSRDRNLVYAGEGYLMAKNHTTRYAAWSGSKLSRDAAVVLTFRDMNEKRRLQEALIHAQRLDAVGHLAGGIAHDFNNLLSVINGYCEILAGRYRKDRKALRQIGEIHIAGMRGAELTRQLLAFGRRQPNKPHVVNFNDIVRDNHEIMKRLIGTHRRLDLELASSVSNVRTDPAQFMQAILNLVLNARDALADNGRIVIATSNRTIGRAMNRRATDTPPGEYVSLSVSDNGCGMDLEAKRHLFEPFYTTKPRGNGLGLALVYGVVQQSGGYVTATSEKGVGTTIEILLPEVSLPVEEAGRTTLVKPLPVTKGKETVLLVDDDDVVRKMVAGILTADGYRVIETRNARFARSRAHAASKPVELLIASLSPAETDSLVKALQQRNPRIRILNVGVNASAPAWFPSEQVSKLPKPFALSELLRAARKALDQ